MMNLKKIIIIGLLFSSSTVWSYYFAYPLGAKKLYLYSGVAVSNGITDSLNIYTQYGFTDWLDVNVYLPGIAYYNSDTKGDFFHSDPSIGFLAKLFNRENKSFSIAQSFFLPVHINKYLSVTTKFIYNHVINPKWNFFTAFYIPANFKKHNLTELSLGVTPLGFEYVSSKYFFQAYLDVSEKVSPYNQFKTGIVIYNGLPTKYITPSIEISYYPNPYPSAWKIIIGFSKLLKF